MAWHRGRCFSHGPIAVKTLYAGGRNNIADCARPPVASNPPFGDDQERTRAVVQAAAAALNARLGEITVSLRGALSEGIGELGDRRLRDHLSAGCSYRATAELLSMHKNSVKYRIEKALELRGAPLEAERSDIELALVACQLLGRNVLNPAGTSA